MTRRTFGRDVAQARALGLDYAAGDRVVTIPRYPMGDGRVMVYWSVVFSTPRGTVMQSGVAPTVGKARKALADAVTRWEVLA